MKEIGGCPTYQLLIDMLAKSFGGFIRGCCGTNKVKELRKMLGLQMAHLAKIEILDSTITPPKDCQIIG